MKKLWMCIALSFLLATPTFSQIETKPGVYLAYGSEIETIGIGVMAEFDIIDHLTLSPGLTFFLPNEDDFFTQSMWELNANAHYYFMNTESTLLYGLAGLNFSMIKVKVDMSEYGLGTTSDSEGEAGLNIGGGARFATGSSITPFAEFRYVLSDFDQLVLAAGIQIEL